MGKFFKNKTQASLFSYYIIFPFLLLWVAYEQNGVLCTAYLFMLFSVMFMSWNLLKKMSGNRPITRSNWVSRLVEHKAVRIYLIVSGWIFGIVIISQFAINPTGILGKTLPSDFVQQTSQKTYSELLTQLGRVRKQNDPQALVQASNNVIQADPANIKARQVLSLSLFEQNEANAQAKVPAYSAIDPNFFPNGTAEDWEILGLNNLRMATGGKGLLPEAKIAYAKAALYDWQAVSYLAHSLDSTNYVRLSHDLINKYETMYSKGGA